MRSRCCSYRARDLTEGTDHFRIVYLPGIRQLEKATNKLVEFLSTYVQK